MFFFSVENKRTWPIKCEEAAIFIFMQFFLDPSARCRFIEYLMSWWDEMAHSVRPWRPAGRRFCRVNRYVTVTHTFRGSIFTFSRNRATIYLPLMGSWDKRVSCVVARMAVWCAVNRFVDLNADTIVIELGLRFAGKKQLNSKFRESYELFYCQFLDLNLKSQVVPKIDFFMRIHEDFYFEFEFRRARGRIFFLGFCWFSKNI